ncbi:nitroreductase family protein [Actinoplanes sp. N902-109]|uniref:Acg family FMN-binding oxidoreductase n=1 Tax=Actinoplanes sp. (strain N902-109) TaxID=649831 RepID=UPI0003294D23|nr:nitroreductase family protein [Actinoplanes sp. N902-109]AGL16978.1 nitroreductase [Actinoplanes sp. N902-109]
MARTVVAPPRPVLTDSVQAAVLAPSLHNSQPWQFRIGGDTVEVYADRRRCLAVLDPTGREMLLSVGAAIFNLRVELRRQGFRTTVALFPDPMRPSLVARVRAVAEAAPPRAAEALGEAIPHRHTNRWPYACTAIPADTLDHLIDAARREGAVLTVAGAVVRNAVVAAAQSADHRLHSRAGYRAELDRWAAPRPDRRDGIPAWAMGPADALGAVPVRVFASPATAPLPVERFEPYPTILLLATSGDSAFDQVRAGQAVQRVLLTATWLGLATMPISQPVEIPAVRRTLGDFVQIVLRVGYGRVVRPTPRRPLGEVLLPGLSADGTTEPAGEPGSATPRSVP